VGRVVVDRLRAAGTITFEEYLAEQIAAGRVPFSDALADYPRRRPRGAVMNRITNTPLRAGMWFLALVGLGGGVVAAAAPRAFYDYVPWVDLDPPFAEHLMVDYGLMNLAMGLVLAVAAITMDRLMVRTVLAAYLLVTIPHLVYHVTHLEHYTATQAFGATTVLAISVLLPLGLLALARERHHTPLPTPK
jgi:hypothetical protein